MPEVLSPEGVKPPTAKTADDINDLFKELDTEPEVKETKEVKEVKEPKEPKEEDELELIEPEEDIEKLDLKEEGDEISAPPRKKEILAKYPDLFKTFPFLEKILYRDREYNELFGSFDDAREAAERAESFGEFEKQLLSGNTSEILKEVKESDENAFNKIVDDYLPSLARADKEAYFHVVGNLNKRLIMEMVKEANDTDNEDLKNAALLVNQFIFGSSKFTAPELRSKKEESTERNEVEQERLSLVWERFETARDDMQTRVDNTLRATISDYIDPRGNMSPYVKKNAVADAMRYLEEMIAADPSVQKNLDKLWRAAVDEHKFSKDSLGRIQSYYLSKAKGNLKQAILKARAEALKDSSSRAGSREKEEEEEETQARPETRRIPSGRPSQPKGKNEVRKGESVTEFFMRD